MSDDGGILCESCGYRLDGLPVEGNCPECGTPVRLSTVDSPRTLSAFEEHNGASAFWRTTLRIWLKPAKAFATLRSRVDDQTRALGASFGRDHLMLASVPAALAMTGHLELNVGSIGAAVSPGPPKFLMLGPVFLVTLLLAWSGLMLGRKLIIAVATFEARWRGMRLPGPVVRRVMDYHVAHLLPVTLMAALVVVAANVAFHLGLAGPATFFNYLVALCGVIVVGSVWLFWTFWLAMSNMLRANV
ncbi:MAG: hypothetical protein AAGI46_03750 [Planctomycetota bacterium]